MNIRKLTIISKNGHKYKVLILLLTSLFSSSFSYPINRTLNNCNSIICCYDFILNRLKKLHVTSIKRFKHNFTDCHYIITSNDNRLNIVRKRHGRITLKSNFKEINQWNNVIDWNKVKYSSIHTIDGDFLIGVAPVAG